MTSLRAGRRLRVGALAVLLSAAAAACSGDDAPSGTTSTTTVADVETTLPPPSTTTPDATTTTTAPVEAALALRGDGLGVVDFGAAPDVAVPAVTAVLGEPTRDGGWEPSFSGYGTCPGEQIRAVEWDGLVLLFTDGTTELGAGEHLFAWRVTGAPPAVSTATGLGFGATPDDAEELYPGRVEVVPPEEPFLGFLRIEAEGGTITAYLDQADAIGNLEAGVACGE